MTCNSNGFVMVLNTSRVTRKASSAILIGSIRRLRKNGLMTKGTNLGFIAQEIEQVIPALVVESAEGYKSVDYISMTAVLM